MFNTGEPQGPKNILTPESILAKIQEFMIKNFVTRFLLINKNFYYNQWGIYLEDSVCNSSQCHCYQKLPVTYVGG